MVRFCDEKISLKKVVSTFTSGGDMSIVGLRPERVEHVEKYTKEILEFEYRTKVKGGLSIICMKE